MWQENPKENPLVFAAARTRSRASRTAASGRPTTSNAGRPPERKHSALTSYPEMPFRPKERTVTTIKSPPSMSDVRAENEGIFRAKKVRSHWNQLSTNSEKRKAID